MGNPFCPTTEYPAIGWIEGYGIATWMLDGNYREGIEHPGDLIEEWREPVTLSRTFYMVRCPDGTLQCWGHQPGEGHVMLAKKIFTVTEGEGME